MELSVKFTVQRFQSGVYRQDVTSVMMLKNAVNGL